MYLQRGQYPRYSAACEDAARTFELRPRCAIYLPALGGHWLRNGSERSISYTVSVRTPRVFREKHCHAMNARLGKLGIATSEFGRHPLRDGAKARVEARLRSILPVRS